jgi:hypothetical protein
MKRKAKKTFILQKYVPKIITIYAYVLIKNIIASVFDLQMTGVVSNETFEIPSFV